MSPTPTPATVEYFGISLFSSRTFWFNAVNLFVLSLSLNEVIAIIPPRYLGLQLAVVTVGNMWLRSITVRPAVLIAPGSTAAVLVPKLDPPDPPAITD